MKKTLFWVLAIFITIASAYYQRKTGPTHPKRVQIDLVDKVLSFKLPRSGDSDEDRVISIPISENSIGGTVHYRRFPLDEPFTSIELQKSDDQLIAYLPKQMPAGKLEYYLSFTNLNTNASVTTDHIVIRFKGSVPGWVLIPHILLMFIAMLLSNLAGILAFGKMEKHVFYGNLALIMLLLGGLLLGPIVQYYAFGQAWTGVPFGWDLTDNKTLIAVIFWIVAVLGNRKEPKYRYTIIASIVLFLIYIIPHSMFGSELDYSSGEVVTGLINLIF